MATAGANRPLKDKLRDRWGALKAERASWRPHWQELSNNLLPRSGRFFTQDRNRGERRYNAIYDSTGTRALSILSAGLMAGATSPARRWFKLRTSDKDLNKYRPVKMWLNDVTTLMETVFQRSNTYRALPTMYKELGCFGTAATIVRPSFDTIIRHHTLTCGEYCLATNFNGEVDTMYREFEMTVAQMVEEFKYENCSQSVRNAYDKGDLDLWHPVIHAIEPRTARDHGNPSAKHMAWGSWYFELGTDSAGWLRESGFEYFPVLAPRWDVAGGDIYGHSPGMEALGDIKQLQHEQLRKAQAIDYQTRPPLQVPTSMKNREVDTLPGGVTYYDPTSPTGGIRSLFEVRLELGHLLADIQDVRRRITGAFYADLFLLLTSAADTRMTATEVAERHEEKLLMLGPVLGRMHTELLSPLIETTFARMQAARIVPEGPPELKEVELDIEFVSTLAQAQRAVGAGSIDRWLGNVGEVAAFAPQVLDNVNVDYWCENYADILGVDPEMIVPVEKVDAIRQDRAAQEQAAAQAEQMEQQSKALANVAQANGPDNQLTNVMDQVTGYNTPGIVPS